ncbi:unnamed protein product [Urochloa decumbens]|uniref:RING-type domain-containing protein n=1 Tax=Urochloa decumbens TaxID=240449 RepID=A0ABC9BLN6_9POAL
MSPPAPPCSGGVMHMTSEDGRRLCITGLSLADPAKAHGRRVTVWAEVGREKRAIGELSPKEPAVAVPPVVLGGEFVLRHDLAVAAAVLLHVRVLGPPAPSDRDDGEPEEEEEAVIVLGQHEEDEEEETVAGDDEDGSAVGVGRMDRVPLFAAPGQDGEFLSLGPARFAAVENTAAFMRVAAAEATTAGDGEEEAAAKEIVVLYRYTRFSRMRGGGGRAVEACRRTKLHRLRFAVPAAGDVASSLAWAGSALGPLIYPGLFRRQLHDLWASLVAAPPAIPPRAVRLQVTVDAGILRREDYSPERMAQMRGALAVRMLDAWPAYYHVGMELHLPEPVLPAKRRVVAGDEEEEECCVCFEVMESGLAAWPGCGHVFHGACVERTLARSEMCPLCRHKLSDPIVRKKTSL